MKFNIRRVIKVSSCFAVIAVVLLASIITPAYAADYIYEPSVMFDCMEVQDNNIITYYNWNKLNVDPFTTVTKNGVHQGNKTGRSFTIPLSVTSTNTVINCTINPLGGPAGNVTYGKYLLSLQDFIDSSHLKYSFSFNVIGVSTHMQSEWKFYANTLIHFYDADFKLLSPGASGRIECVYDTSAGCMKYEGSLDVYRPADAFYMAPQITYSIEYASNTTESNLYISYQGGTFSTTLNAVLENSATMDKIKDQIGDVSDKLDDLNDKTDTIINGTPEMNNSAQDNSEKLDEVEGDLNNSMDDMDDKTDLDQILPDQAQKPEDLEVYVDEYQDSEGWRLIKQVFKPILEHEYVKTILMMIIAFVNISVLLIGR